MKKPKILDVKDVLYGATVVLLVVTLIVLSFSPYKYTFSPNIPEVQGMGMPYEENALADLAGLDISLELEAAITGAPEPVEYSKPRMLLYSAYTIRSGDTIGELARAFGLNQDTLLSSNSIKNSRLLQIGQVLKIPNQDGIFYMVKAEDTLETIAERYSASPAAIQTANELFSESIRSGVSLFIPGARLNQLDLQEINGDLFMWPAAGFVTSPYGYRTSPFTGIRQFHTGLDIGCPIGTAVRAAQSGRVSSVGNDEISGNFIVISHHSGYRTLYAHLSVIRVKTGAYVKAGELIGDAGNTGLSTGPHLHFTVYKDGVTVNPRTLIN